MRRSDSSPPPLPGRPLDRVLEPLERFLDVEAAGGIVLLVCTVVALIIANSSLGDAYDRWWHTPVGIEIGSFHLRKALDHWVNDGLMTLFFFVVGLEVKRELVVGDLRDARAAALPIAGAIGGMVVPAGLYLALLGRTPAAGGWGIAMATDIAFVVGCMAVLGRRVPHGLRVMLLSLAIADDIGAILVIAVGYTAGIAWLALALGVLGIGVTVLCERVGIRSLGIYTLIGIAVWVAFVQSGIHPTVAGVILGLLTPAHPYLSNSALSRSLDHLRDLLHGGGGATGERVADVRTLRRASREAVSPLAYLETLLHPWVSFVIMPIFALANAAVHFHGADLTHPVAVGIGVSLLLGKPIGIVASTWLGVASGTARLPTGVSWAAVAGGGALCGIGFTMALFIANLALDGPALAAAKVGILGGSALAAMVGMLGLYAIGANDSSLG